MNTTLRNLLGFTLLAAIVLAMACQCFGQDAVVGQSLQDGNGWTVVPYPPAGGGDMYFIDQDGGNDANDGRDPNGFDLSTATYTHSTRTLTSSGAFSSYTHTGGDRTDVIYIIGATGGVAAGYYIIESKTSNDAIVLEAAAGLTADATGVSSSDGPVSTLAAGYALVTTDQDDQLLLQRGDTWTAESFGQRNKGGISQTQPLLISSYGSGNRPIVDVDEEGTFLNVQNAHYVFVMDMDLTAVNTTTNNPAGLKSSSDGVGETAGDILFENCRIDSFSDAISVQPVNGGETMSNITIRRCVLVDSYARSDTSAGIYSTGVDGLVIEENFMDHNGWNDPLDAADLLSHNMYITHETASATIRNNIVSQGSNMGLKFQPVQGTHYIYGNIFVRNSYACQYGGGKGDAQIEGVGITVYSYNNIHAEEQDNGTGQRIGVTLANLDGGCFRNNLTIHATGTTTQCIGVRAYEGAGVGVQNFVIDRNVSFNWQGQHYTRYLSADLDTITFSNNITQEPYLTSDINLINHFYPEYFGTSAGNIWYSNRAANARYKADGTNFADYAAYASAVGETGGSEEEIAFTDDTRTVTTWATTQKSLADYDAFVAACTANHKDNYDSDYTAEVIGDWLREGYDLEEYSPVGTKKVLILQ